MERVAFKDAQDTWQVRESRATGAAFAPPREAQATAPMCASA
jgi:hypothetical protein